MQYVLNKIILSYPYPSVLYDIHGHVGIYASWNRGDGRDYQ
ncbi:MAG: hypothetical protein Q7I96_08920 [Methanobacteriaceae archaeon]|nr:hypothetical protein [Methanobacteriaceae archaeon]